MITVYVAGPMSGLPDFNRPAFFEATTQLEAAGYWTVNPARRPVEEGKPWAAYLREALVDVTCSDAVALLPGWENSDGARLEVDVANGLGMPVHTLGAYIDASAAAQLDALGDDDIIREVEGAARRGARVTCRPRHYVGITDFGVRFSLVVSRVPDTMPMRPIPMTGLQGDVAAMLGTRALDRVTATDRPGALLWPVGPEVFRNINGDDGADDLRDDEDDEGPEDDDVVDPLVDDHDPLDEDEHRGRGLRTPLDEHRDEADHHRGALDDGGDDDGGDDDGDDEPAGPLPAAEVDAMNAHEADRQNRIARREPT